MFAQQYTIPKELNAEPKRRSKKVVFIARRYCSPDPDGPKYEQYYHQSLMQHKSFRQMSELLAVCETYAEAHATFLLTGNIPQSLESDILRVQHNTDEQSELVHTEVCLCCLLVGLYILEILKFILVKLTILSIMCRVNLKVTNQQPLVLREL